MFFTFSYGIFGILPEVILFLCTLIYLIFGLGLMIYSKSTSNNYNYYNSYNYLTFLSFFYLFMLVLQSLINFAYYDSFLFSMVDFLSSFSISFQNIMLKLISVFFFIFFLIITYYYANHSNDVSSTKNIRNSFEFFLLLYCIMFSTLMVLNSNNFIVFYNSLELQSMVLYVYIIIDRIDTLSIEAAIKYLIYSSISSGLLLFSISLFYLMSSSFSFFDIQLFLRLTSKLEFIYPFSTDIRELLYYSDSKIDFFPVYIKALLREILYLATFFLFFSFLFKFSLFPFHSWVVDVYNSTSVLGLTVFSVLSKLGPFLFLYKVLFFLGATYSYTTKNPFYFPFSPLFIKVFLISSFITLIIGSIGGLYQTSIRTIWAYSTLTNFSFIFFGFDYLNYGTLIHMTLYFLGYMLLNLFFFFFLSQIKVRVFGTWREPMYLVQLVGLRQFSYSAYLLVRFVLLVIIGIPPFFLFFLKVNLLREFCLNSIAEKDNLHFFMPIFLLISLFSYYYYMRIFRSLDFQFHYKYHYVPIFYSSINNKSIIVSLVLFLLLNLFIVTNLFFLNGLIEFGISTYFTVLRHLMMKYIF